MALSILAVATASVGIPASRAATTSINSGSLGAAGNGTNTDGVTFAAGAISAGNDLAAVYNGGSTSNIINTTVPFKLELNPAATAPFTIEFWAKPSVDVTDALGPSPVFNRVTNGNRSGWVFFQRSAATGWNFAMYHGNLSQVGIQVTGGPYTVGSWTHVVSVWNGTVPTLYVNGVNTNASVVTQGAGGYNPNTPASPGIFSLGSYDTGSNPFTGAVDETAFYATALTGAQILAHFNAASSAVPGAYSSLVLQDGAVEYLRNIPEPTSVVMLGLAGSFLAARRRRLR